MMDMGYPLHLIDLLAKLYRKQLAKVKVAGTLSEWFPVKKGVRQGCVLSPYLFNILAEMVMRETFDGFQGGLQIRGRMITNLCYANDIILLATSEAELQELVDRLDRVSRRYSLLINIDKTKVMVSDGIACCILIQNEQLAQVNTFNLGLWLQGEWILYQVKQRAGDRGITAENTEKSRHTDFNEDKTNESASVACSHVRLWKLDTQEEWRNTSWGLW